MKISALFVLSFLAVASLAAQQFTYDWHFTAGGLGPDRILGSTVDHDGNSILVGNFEESIVIGDSTYQADEFATDGFLIKLDAQGDVIWQRELNTGTFDDIFPFDVAVDNENNILVAGSFRGTVDADPSAEEFNLTSELDDIYLSKFDADGNMIWAQTVRGANTEERILDVHLAEDGMLYLGGYIDISVDRNNDIPLLMKVNPVDTSIVWNYAIGTDGRIDGISEVTSFGDHIYATGSFEGEGVFSTSPENELTLDAGAGKDLFVFKLTKDRELVWAINVGTDLENNDVEGRSIAVDGNGDLYISGDYDGLIDFDPGSGVAELDGFIQSFLLKLSSDGEFIWVVDNEGLRGKKVILDDADQPLAAFEISSGEKAGFEINSLSTQGDTLGKTNILAESIFDVSLREMQFGADQSVFIAANFSGPLRYDPNSNIEITPTDEDDDLIYIKLDQSMATSAEDISISELTKIYPNPVGDMLKIDLQHELRAVDFEILDLLGKQLASYHFKNVSALQIPFDYSSGQYYIKYKSEDGETGIQKVLKL